MFLFFTATSLSSFHQGTKISWKGLVCGIVEHAASNRVVSIAEYNWLTWRRLMLMEESFCSQILLNSGHWTFHRFHGGKKVLIVSCTWLRLILLQPFRWCCVDCVIRHERDVREEQHHTYMWHEQAIIEWSRHMNSIVACCHNAKLCAHATRDFRSQQNGAVTRMWRTCRVQPSHKERAIGADRCKKEGMLLQPLRWCSVDCVIHHERDVREEQHHGFLCREQAIIEWSWHVNSIVACCHSAKLSAHAARDFRSQLYQWWSGHFLKSHSWPQ